MRAVIPVCSAVICAISSRMGSMASSFMAVPFVDIGCVGTPIVQRLRTAANTGPPVQILIDDIKDLPLGR